MKNIPNKKIVVKQRVSTRIVFHGLASVFYVGWIVAVATAPRNEISWVDSIICLAICLVGLSLQLYFELWRITFTSKEIHIQRWPFREKTYSYAMIREVTKGYAAAENDYLICCVFADGKSVTFGLKYENANQAIKRLLSHRTIRNASCQRTS